MVRRVGVLLFLVVAFMLGVADASWAQRVMTRHVREAVRNGQAKSLGALPAEQTLRLTMVLPLRDQAGLDAF